MAGTRSSTRRRAGVEETNKPSKSTSRVRVASPRAPRTTRQTRSGTAARVAEVSSSSAKQVRPQSRSRGGSNIARRSARPSAETRSVASIATSVARGSDYDESSNEEDGEEDADEVIVRQLAVERGGSEEVTAFYRGTHNADIMVKLRNKLYEAAHDLYDHLCLEDRNETWDEVLGTFRDVFNRFKAHYSSEGTHFLDRMLIIEALPDQTAAVSAVSHIVSAANLVILMSSIHQVMANQEEALHLLREIDEDFPRCIMASESATANSYEEHGTFDRALDIRISLWILQIGANQAFTEEAAMELGSLLLFGTSGEHTLYPNEIDANTIEFLPIDGVEFDDHENEDESQRHMRKDIFRAFEHVCQFITNGEVDLGGLLEAFSINHHLNELFRWAKGLFGEVVKTIALESARPATDDQADTAGPQKSLYKGMPSLQGLARAQNSQPATTRDAVSRKRLRQEDVDEGDVSDFVAVEDGEEEEVFGPAHKRPKTRTTRTRPAGGTQSTRTDRQSTEDAPRGSDTAAQRSRISVRSETPPAVQRKLQMRVSWEKRDERALEKLVSVHGSFWARMELRARNEKLFSVERSQQQIRDKARNMKVDMLKDDKLLSNGFDNVALGNKERQRLIGLRKNPDRREADVEYGRPVNTEYVEVEFEDEE